MKNLARHIYRRIRAQLLQRMIPKSKIQLPAQLEDLHIEVIGFFNSISGIGESARLCAQQLANDGFLVTCTSVEKYFRKPNEMDWHWKNPSIENKKQKQINCRIFHLNPPMLPPVILQMGLDKFKTTYNIGYWAWELETIPNEWISAIRYMNAIITPSGFTTDVIQRYADYPVLTATHPVNLGDTTQNLRDQLNIPEQAFLVSSIFSFGSAMERKNPQALIAAFTASLATQPNTYLVLKTNAGGDSPEKRQLLETISKYPNILLIDKQWTRADILGLIQCSDLYASLHRSEGFGLTLAEAMLLGTPVLTTAWSGNMDFCTAENSFLVPAKPIEVNASHPEFNGLEQATWADADIAIAKKLLLDIYQDRSLITAKKACCAQQMQSCIDHHKYQHALQNLVNLRTNPL